uniref:Uncharacterized protein n=1 Tax=Schistocephalus solidus TaxID=70667 RepID=A0A0X3PX92_SCHSO
MSTRYTVGVSWSIIPVGFCAFLSNYFLVTGSVFCYIWSGVFWLTPPSHHFSPFQPLHQTILGRSQIYSKYVFLIYINIIYILSVRLIYIRYRFINICRKRRLHRSSALLHLFFFGSSTALLGGPYSSCTSFNSLATAFRVLRRDLEF